MGEWIQYTVPTVTEMILIENVEFFQTFNRKIYFKISQKLSEMFCSPWAENEKRYLIKGTVSENRI